ncbi:CD209 antigen-like protein D [Uranotaenia lowii]|uniref:CD209 antigen-like protein D n=1 Tax=Uranotaenia lowii TaxID=190385 RepID=UPI00247925AC|nr:CD209 antigen-like protein D [Uranotaenia lowii]
MQFWFNIAIQLLLLTCCSWAASLNGTQTLDRRNGPVKSSRSSFRYVDMQMKGNFWTAMDVCRSHGMQLPRITTADQAVEFLLAIASDMDGSWWIGGSNMGGSNHWHWTSDGQPLMSPHGYHNWGPGEPAATGGNCLLHRYRFWYRSACANVFKIACQVKTTCVCE